MTKQIAFAIAAVLLAAFAIRAQQPEAPFAVMDRLVKGAPLVWSGPKDRLSEIFDDERKRLGPQFESELMKWLEQDPTKHYWVSAFIECEDYLHGNKRLPELSLLIKEQGLTLVRGKNDDESRGFVIGLSMTAAVLSDELGLKTLASGYKFEAESLLLKDPSLGGYTPAMSEKERRRYDEIKAKVTRRVPVVFSDAAQAAEGNSQSPDRAPITGGILNGRAVKLAKPKYPSAARDARISGTVQVRVLIDEAGKVISATAITGHPDLHKASEDAAMKSEFTPTRLAGQPVKVSGTIVYNFVAR